MRRVTYGVTTAVLIGGILAAMVILREYSTGTTPIAAAQSTGPQPTTPFAGITVSGSSTANAAPDVAYVTAGVQTQAASAKDATSANNSTMAAVIAAIKSQGIPADDIQTNTFNISPVYSQPRGTNETPTITAYRVTNAVNATVRTIASAASVLDAAVQAGANSNVSIRFGIRDTTALQEQALSAAVQQAAAKAGAIAKEAGVKLTGVYSVSEQGVSSPMPRAATASAASQSVPVETGQMAITANIVAVYSYTR